MTSVQSVPPPRFVRNLTRYLTHWQAETAVLTPAQIQALDPEFPNLCEAIQPGILVEPTRPLTAKLMLQCFFWVESQHHVKEWQPYLEQLIPLLPEDQPYLRFRLLKQLGQLYRLDRDFAAALTAFATALPLAHSAQKEQGKADLYINMAQLYRQQEDGQQALFFAERALAHLHETPSRLKAIVQQTLGQLYTERGQEETAVSHLQSALDIYRNSPNITDTTRTMNLLALAYKQMGHTDSALNLFAQADKLLDPLTFARDKIELRINWGATLYDQNQLDAAAALFTEVLQLVQEQKGSHQMQAMLHNNLALIFSQQNDLSKAEAYYQQSLHDYTVIGSKFYMADTLNNLAELYLRQHNNAQAIDSCHQALKLLQTLPANNRTDTLLQKIQQKLASLDA